MASPKTLLEWCRVTCANYPGVDIKDMSSSFRDGLAFCAIIHKHRPDLIDFSSLSKDDGYQNNKLAFEVAETKLGIAALLEPKELLSARAPDCLSVITYVSQFYYFFNRKACAFPSRSRSSHGTKSNKTFKGLTDVETGGEERCPQTRSAPLCDSCFTPVHLIQRRLSAGKVYHRSCFRCKICASSLLFDSCTHGSVPSSLFCADHVRDAQTPPADLSQHVRPAGSQPGCRFQTGHSGLYSLDGSAITSVPRYARAAASRNEPARTPTQTPPVPAARKSLDSSSDPVPAPRIRTAQTTSGSSAAENQCKSPPGSSYIPKVKPSHPWMALVHPGPWTQLPPAPPPVPSSRSKSTSNVLGSSNRPRVPAPPNPFEEVEVEDSDGEPESSVAVVRPENSEDTRDGVGSSDTEEPIAYSEQDAGKTPDQQLPPKTPPSEGEGHEDASPGPAEGEAGVPDTEGRSAQTGAKEAAAGFYSPSARKHNLPRSLSVPAITSEHHQTNSVSAGRQEANDSVTSSDSKSLSSPRGPAPSHGFPLIRRKVQSDQYICMNELQKQKRELDGCLEELERRGVELERNIRDGKGEDQRLTEWIALFHERHVTLHKDKDLVYLIKQQKLEDRQEDVEYELRCLLNKPERDWSQEDRSREQQLMEELVTIIEQRNQIISSLDQDMQREKDGDVFWENQISDKNFQKGGVIKLKKSKGLFKMEKCVRI
ncbi:MICAL-like protein 1 isoform X2 [Kryptolebias marmoratus]|uniref:MICAL like 1b, duplicate 2 n=1 Tax=Kryptolebias marmoratus TaxID=37003 RepID=A0A3Q3B4X8_KRYMA|nr:MICAL-like protein 1 isoform X2 [Kryptolebias marmoratus]